jgi:hypothetical protein
MIEERRMRWVGHVAHMGKIKCGYKVLFRKCEWRTSRGRPGRRWKDNIKWI